MKALLHALLSVGLMFTVWSDAAAQQRQQNATVNTHRLAASDAAGRVSPPSAEPRAQLKQLQKRKALLENYLLGLAPSSQDYRATERAIKETTDKLRATAEPVGPRPPAAPRAGAADGLTGNLFRQDARPDFSLASPKSGRTNIPLTPLLTWTEDRRNGTFLDPPLYTLTRFKLVVAKDRRFSDPVFTKEDIAPASDRVTPSPRAPKGVKSIETSFTIPESDQLEPGTTYYWKVSAFYTLPGATREDEVEAENGVFMFITAIDPFKPLTDRNIYLQRTVDSTDATEGAQFAFLKTFGGDTAFTADFALFWDSRSRSFKGGRGFVWFRPAVEGKLTSDESESEDAWKFSGSAVIDYNFLNLKRDAHGRPLTGENADIPRRLIDGIYLELGGSLEGDQDFDTRKLMSRVYFTPSSRKLAIGTALGQIDSPVQFMWRPSFEFNAGRTFERGASAETGDNVLRLVPRVRMTLYTRGISRLLRLANSYLYADNTFYYLPVDDVKKRRNYFTSGYEVLFIKNFGFGLTYKNGEPAPNFRRVNTFGGVLTIRFGPE